MAFRHPKTASLLSIAAMLAGSLSGARAQVFVVGEKTATADISTDFHPTRVELPSTPISERGRLELIRNLEAEQGFAHRALPLGDDLILMANGNLKPSGEAYREMIYKKGQSAAPGDRIAITTVTVKADRIIFDLNGGPYLKHRFLRHVQIDGMNVVPDDGAQVTGCRITLLFEGGIPDISAPEVKALLDPIIDFGVKTSAEAYANSLPSFLKDAIARHDVLVGMDRKMVLAAMGAPLSKVRELMPGSVDTHYEEWIFGQVPQTVRFVRFVGDRVVQVRVAALGQAIAIHDQNEMQGYLDPEDTHELAMGDAKSGSGEAGAVKPPTILKPGEVAPGSSQQVQMPVSVPKPTPVSNDPGPASPQDTPADKPASQLVASAR
jgi:hypothetical protein